MKLIVLLSLAYICYTQYVPDCKKVQCLCLPTESADTTNILCTHSKTLPCYKNHNAICRKNRDGKCAWVYNNFLTKCLNKSKYCIIGGCSNEVCGENTGEEIISPCIYKPEYQCYKGARCEIQRDGYCNWTKTRKLEKCLKRYGSEY